MSIRVDRGTTGYGIVRTATAPQNQSWSVTWWEWLSDYNGDTNTLFLIGNAGLTEYMRAYISGGPILSLQTSPGSAVEGSGGTVPVGAWRRCALVFDTVNNLVTLYQGDADPTTDLVQVVQQAYATNFVPARVEFGVMDSNSQPFNGRLANIKFYNEVITTAQAKAELRYFNIQEPTNLWGAWTLKSHTDLTDQSGNGRDMSAEGTLTTEADPPITDGPSGAEPFLKLEFRAAA